MRTARRRPVNIWTWDERDSWTLVEDHQLLRCAALAAMSFLRQLPRARSYVCHQCARRQRPSLDLVRNKSNSKSGKAQENAAEMAAAWKEKAARIRMGNQKSMLDTLEERGFIKDIAGYVFLGKLHQYPL